MGALGEFVRYHSHVPDKLGELAILTVARELHCQYMFTAHARIARDVGMADNTIEAVAQGRVSDAIAGDEVLVAKFAQELVLRRRLVDATWEATVRRFGINGAIDLTVTVGYYIMMAHLLLALDVELEEGVQPALPEYPDPGAT